MIYMYYNIHVLEGGGNVFCFFSKNRSRPKQNKKQQKKRFF